MRKISLILSGFVLSALLLFSCTSGHKEVKIGNQVWMIENLNVDKFRNGDPIPEVKSEEEWKKVGEKGQPAWCYYDNDPANGEKYGKLYNWFAVNDPRGLAPDGWKIPSEVDWSRLFDFIGGESVAGQKMKSAELWAENVGKPGSGTNESGYSGLPGGVRIHNGKFIKLGYEAHWWSSETYPMTYSEKFAWYHFLIYGRGNVVRNSRNKTLGLSVRCLRE
ncbi:MAG: hypothetical protein RIT10_341 [Bacteroidota bacterium]|jgi:uncharacterized protein (TIGR02145 family)